ncbi:glycogen synthase [Hippea alviniae]|uniref:glycogen synthase n=1 Tax=Hippea alviniae TaxID=1279027 RepID=UPI0003F64E5E|nr:glycogen/starch synthase [Hippea alviniae]
MKILFAAAELLGYAKSGGLADVSFSLPKALGKFHETVRVVPAYEFAGLLGSKVFEFSVFGEDVSVYLDDFGNIKTYFVFNETLSKAEHIYTQGENEPLRFAIFSKSIIEIAKRLNMEVLILNDWHTAVASYYAKIESLKAKTILVIHNLCYQGVFDSSILERAGIRHEHFTPDAFEFYGKLNMLKGGIAFCDKLITVSKRYAEEILTEQFGCGLDGFLLKNKDKLTGILNGIDYDEFNPENDRFLRFNFSLKNLQGKWLNKRALIKDIGLKNASRPLFAFIGRLTQQKGIELLKKYMDRLLEKEINFVMIGDGKTQDFKDFSKYSNFYFKEGYDESFARNLYAASDFILVPSEFEPCGLTQLIGFRYGVIPIARAVGGLKETINEDFNKPSCGAGFLFEKEEEFLQKIEEAIKLFKNKNQLNLIRKFNMQCDFSADRSAKEYLKVLEEL